MISHGYLSQQVQQVSSNLKILQMYDCWVVIFKVIVLLKAQHRPCLVCFYFLYDHPSHSFFVQRSSQLRSELVSSLFIWFLLAMLLLILHSLFFQLFSQIIQKKIHFRLSPRNYLISEPSAQAQFLIELQVICLFESETSLSSIDQQLVEKVQAL